MMNDSTITGLYRHMEWADAAVWAAVLASDSGQDDLKLHAYFHHLHVTQYAFLRIWQGGAIDMSFPTFDDARSLMRWGQAYYAQAFAFLADMTEAKCAETIVMPWAEMITQRIGRTPAPVTLNDTLLQVDSHSTYHRGQINARLRELGGQPPLVDYIAWMWLGRPAATWPASDE